MKCVELFSPRPLTNPTNSNPINAGKSITSYKTALAVFGKLKPSFGRVPMGDSQGMTANATIFFEVEDFELKGSFGENVWDMPVDVVSNPAIGEWVHGLGQDGGAG